MANLFDFATFWSAPAGSGALWGKIALALVVGFAFLVACLYLPSNLRRPVVATFTFVSGLFYVLYFLWPRPFDWQPGEATTGTSEEIGAWFASANPVVSNFASILTAFLLGLGAYSILRIHLGRISKQQRDWGFSVVLIASMLLMIVFGYLDWIQRQDPTMGPKMALEENWGLVQKGRDFLFDGLLQQMDAAMFSIIAFYILSAAYRAFRIRSIEATIMLAAAFIMMLSLLGGIVEPANDFVLNTLARGNPDAFVNNFQLGTIAAWIKDTFQTSSIRAIEFGIGIGALAMGLRLWLSLERGGVSS
ncbi:MAG: hypothetical protein HONBIEJF_02885 [Fimbriimonadaceae bacterium]|nr:hypothetical protein [Fimbriimonadaceae bacterium]